MIGSGSNPVDRLANALVLVIAFVVACFGIGGLFFTASVLSYRFLEWLFG